MDVVNEKSGFELEAAFYDGNQNPTLPSTVHWRLDCETTDRVVQSDTAVDVLTEDGPDGITRYSVTIDVSASLNAMQNTKNARELKKLLVIANKDQSGEFSMEYPYYVRNLRGRS